MISMRSRNGGEIVSSVFAVQIMVAEVVILLGIEHFEQCRLRVPAKIRAHFVDLVDHHDGVARPGVANRANDGARHRADVRAPMAANFGFVANAAHRKTNELPPHRPSDRLTQRRLSDAGRSDEAQDRPGQLLLELSDR
jgi:hypothetical protein